ncbi:LacI family DNA-binding transcriptional regulator [Inquilinus sp. CAU 1745]
MPRTNGPIINDVAARAGVSPATVDRVINKRPGVRALTSRRVLQAAAELGYLPEEDILKSLRPQPMRLVFLLPAGTNPYLQLLGDTVKAISARPPHDDVRIRCFFIDSFNPKILTEALRRYGEKADGVAFMAIDHPLVREAASALRAKGKHVVTIVSDISGSSRTAYIGLDNRAVGRTAAYLLGRLAGSPIGKLALIAASRTYRAHEEREMGFLGLMEESFPNLSVVGVREGHDNRDENYRRTLELLAEYPDLIGIYNVGGSSDGIARALREQGRDQDMLFIGHGLTADTRSLLLEDTMDVVITQNPDMIVHNALRVFVSVRRGDDPLSGIAPLTMEVIVKENLP